MSENPDNSKFYLEYPVDESTADAMHRLFLFGSKRDVDEDLIKYARVWLREFPTVQKAPSVLGPAAKYIPIEEFNNYAEIQLKHFPLKQLAGLISVVFKVSDSEILYEIIEEKLLANPDYKLGFLCFSKIAEANSRTDLLIQKWLEIDRDVDTVELYFLSNHRLSIKPTSMIFDRLKVQRTSDDLYGLTISNLLKWSHLESEQLNLEIADTAREWISEFPESEDVPDIYEALLDTSGTERDSAIAREWYHKNSSHKYSGMILAALLRRRDTIAHEVAIQLTRRTPAKERIFPVLKELLSCDPSGEIKNLAKETYYANKDRRLLTCLLQSFDDSDLVIEGVRIVRNLRADITDYQLLNSLLNWRPEDEVLLSISKRWKEMEA